MYRLPCINMADGNYVHGWLIAYDLPEIFSANSRCGVLMCQLLNSCCYKDQGGVPSAVCTHTHTYTHTHTPTHSYTHTYTHTQTHTLRAHAQTVGHPFRQQVLSVNHAREVWWPKDEVSHCRRNIQMYILYTESSYNDVFEAYVPCWHFAFFSKQQWPRDLQH